RRRGRASRGRRRAGARGEARSGFGARAVHLFGGAAARRSGSAAVDAWSAVRSAGRGRVVAARRLRVASGARDAARRTVHRMSEARRPATRLEREDRIVTLTLDRPETLNAYDKTMRDEIFATLEWLHREPEVSVLVVRGEGRAFSTGGDLNEFGTAPSPVRA